MDNATNNFNLIYEKAKKYTETSIALYKLSAIDKSSDIISSLTHKLILGLFVAMFTLFINIGISIYIGEALGNDYIGFFIVSLIYLFLGIIVLVFGNKLIKTPINNLVISKLLKSKRTGINLLDNIKKDVNENI